MDEFQQAREAANRYSYDLLRVYSNPNHRKTKRLNKIVDFLKNIQAEIILSTGCGAAMMEIEIAKALGRKIIGVDFSSVAILLAKKEIEGAVKKRLINADSVSLVCANIMRESSFKIVFPLVVCFDVVGAFSLENKKKFIQQVWKNYVRDGGRLLLNVLSYKNEKVEKRNQEMFLANLGYNLVLHSETMATYAELVCCSLKPRPQYFIIERLDCECLLIDIVKG